MMLDDWCQEEESHVQFGCRQDMGLPLPPALSSHSSRHFVSTVPKEVPGGHSLRVSAAHAHFGAKPVRHHLGWREATHRVGDLRTAGHPLDPQTIEGQDHEESRFWRWRGWDVSDIPLPVTVLFSFCKRGKAGVGCIRYMGSPRQYPTLLIFVCLVKSIAEGVMYNSTSANLISCEDFHWVLDDRSSATL